MGNLTKAEKEEAECRPFPVLRCSMTQKRLSKDNYLWHIAFAAAKRGTCDRFRGGCVVAREGVLIATGYNGSAPGEQHCDRDGHEMIWTSAVDPTEDEWADVVSHCVRTIHAEINAVINAAYLGVSIRGCDWYFTGVPCQRCGRVISRLEPQKLFIRADAGGVDENAAARLHWWHKRRHTTGVEVHARTLVELTDMGVTE